MNKIKTLLLFVVLAFLVFISGQNVQAQIIEADTVVAPIKIKEHSPHRATLYSALLPGLGQIYNRKYWKLPILYGGIGVTLYAIGWNTSQYNDYKNAYVDFSKFLEYKNRPEDSDLPKPKPERYLKLIGNVDFNKTDARTDDWYKTRFQNGKDKYKRDRDLSYIILFGVYVLNIIDATVDAHLSTFNINDNLTMTVQPKMNYTPVTGSTLGLSCRINF